MRVLSTEDINVIDDVNQWFKTQFHLVQFDTNMLYRTRHLGTCHKELTQLDPIQLDHIESVRPSQVELGQHGGYI